MIRIRHTTERYFINGDDPGGREQNISENLECMSDANIDAANVSACYVHNAFKLLEAIYLA